MNIQHNRKWVLMCLVAGIALPILIYGQEQSSDEQKKPSMGPPPMQDKRQDGMPPRGQMQNQEGMRRGQMPRMDQERPDVIMEVMSRHPGIHPDEVMRFIQEQFPEEMERLQDLKRKNPREADEVLTDLIENAINLLEMRHKNPEQFKKAIHKTKLDREAEHLGVKCRNKDVMDKEQILKEMRNVLEQSFELKQELMKMEVAELEREIQELKKMIEKRQENKKVMIERRVKELTGKEPELQW
ncbi:MAG: hypothetical protein PHR77_12900 [Kiritimatiellae bacterium]|nr:hypothetical protein [Kiritimatiellia bacterium]MDD5521103.1 hypothetical protein [Kiritimatiellia bacterium]